MIDGHVVPTNLAADDISRPLPILLPTAGSLR
jgi:hypothetical protein